jgi:hypothetical protein
MMKISDIFLVASFVFMACAIITAIFVPLGIVWWTFFGLQVLCVIGQITCKKCN